MNRLRNLDAYPKINEDFYKRTLSGGVITLFSSVVMLILFFSELRKCISLFKARCFVVYSFFFFKSLWAFRALHAPCYGDSAPCGYIKRGEATYQCKSFVTVATSFMNWPYAICSLMLRSLRFNARSLVLIQWMLAESGTLMWYVLAFFFFLKSMWLLMLCLIFLIVIVQRHDIIKRRLDSHGNVIESKQDGIGHTKVDFPKTLVLFSIFRCSFFLFHCEKS